MSWMPHYLIGNTLLFFGLSYTFGYGGVCIGLGAVIMLGAFGQFVLTKVQEIVTSRLPSDQLGCEK